MVNVTKGVLVECDPAMKQFLLHLDETLKLGSRFIIQDLDETHLFISSDVLGRRPSWNYGFLLVLYCGKRGGFGFFVAYCCGFCI
jgi:TFIIH basal transcription factor complex TTD-A subunit